MCVSGACVFLMCLLSWVSAAGIFRYLRALSGVVMR